MQALVVRAGHGDPRANRTRKMPKRANDGGKGKKKHEPGQEEEDASDNVYYFTFQDGPMGIGLDPVPGESVGSIVSIVVELSQADKSNCIVNDRIEEKIDEQNEYILTAMFHKFDTDRSGTLDLVELRQMLTFYGKNDRAVPSVLETKQLMQLIDADKSKRIELQEWVMLMLFGFKKNYAERKKMAATSTLHKKLNNFTYEIKKGVSNFLTNLHELWCMYDRNHVGFLTPIRVGDMLQHAYKIIYVQTSQLGEAPAAPKHPPSDEDVKLFIGVINSTCDAKHHAHDEDGNELLTEDAFTLFMLQGLKDAEHFTTQTISKKRIKAVYRWRHKMVKMLMWSETSQY